LRFLALNPYEADRVGVIEGIKQPDGGCRAIYFVLIGACQFLNSFTGLRKTANVKLSYDPSKGFNEDSIQLIVATRNNAGVGVEQEMLLSYGPEYDLDVTITKSADFLARQKGPLFKLWEQPPDTMTPSKGATGAAVGLQGSATGGAGTQSAAHEPEEQAAASSQNAPVEQAGQPADAAPAQPECKKAKTQTETVDGRNGAVSRNGCGGQVFH
jgi:hypothetical protein